jgi:hypothetical protein
MDCIQSAAYQKDRAQHKAFLAWEHKFGLECCLTQFCLNVTGSSDKGHTFWEHIITDPPSFTHHPLWSAATEWKRTSMVEKLASQCTQGTPLWQPFSWLSTMHSQACMPNVFDQLTLQRHSHASAVLLFTHHLTSLENAHGYIKHVLTLVSIHTCTHLLWHSFITPSLVFISY